MHTTDRDDGGRGRPRPRPRQAAAAARGRPGLRRARHLRRDRQAQAEPAGEVPPGRGVPAAARRVDHRRPRQGAPAPADRRGPAADRRPRLRQRLPDLRRASGTSPTSRAAGAADRGRRQGAVPRRTTPRSPPSSASTRTSWSAPSAAWSSTRRPRWCSRCTPATPPPTRRWPRRSSWGAQLVLAAPCCHHDIAAQLREAPTPSPYAMLTRHGILRERLADTLTDGLRASLMRPAGLPGRRRAVRREPAHAAQHDAARGPHRRPGQGRLGAQGVRRAGHDLGDPAATRRAARIGLMLDRVVGLRGGGALRARVSPPSPAARRRPARSSASRTRRSSSPAAWSRRTGCSSPPTTPATRAGCSWSTRPTGHRRHDPVGRRADRRRGARARRVRARCGSATSATTPPPRDSVQVLRVPGRPRRPDGRADDVRPGLSGRVLTTPRRLLVNPRTGRLLVVSKDVFGGIVLRRAAKTLSATGPNTLRAIGDALPVATDGAFFPDGRHVIVRNYTSAAVYTYPRLEKIATVPAARPAAGREHRGRRATPGLRHQRGRPPAVLKVTLPGPYVVRSRRERRASRPPPTPRRPPRRRPPWPPRSRPAPLTGGPGGSAASAAWRS